MREIKRNFIEKGLNFCFLAFFGITSISASHAQSGLADAMCQAYMTVVEQALYFRDQGIPIGIAKEMADSAFDTNRDLWFWLNDVIGLSFQDPNLVRAALRDGRLTQSCVQSVRGY